MMVLWLAALVGSAVGFQLRGPTSGKLMTMLWGGSSGGGAIPAGKKIAVITGTTSGLGLETARALLNRGDYYVICANRDVGKMEAIAEQEGFDAKSYKVLELDLGSFDSTRKFAKKLQSVKSRPLDALVCNAAVYQPALDTVRLPPSLFSLFSLRAVLSLSLSFSFPSLTLLSSPFPFPLAPAAQVHRGRNRGAAANQPPEPLPALQPAAARRGQGQEGPRHHRRQHHGQHQHHWRRRRGSVCRPGRPARAGRRGHAPRGHD